MFQCLYIYLRMTRIMCFLVFINMMITSLVYAGYPAGEFDTQNEITKNSLNKGNIDQDDGVSANKMKHTATGLTKLIVKFHSGTSRQKRLDRHAQLGMYVHAQLRQLKDFDIVELGSNANMADSIKQYEQLPSVAYVEPDTLVHILTPPNDPELSLLWGLHNTGQTGGSVDADVNALEAWAVTQGDENLVLAVIDTGVAYDHEDLQANMWVNPGEIASNGIDDDGNGYIDDIHGIDAVNDDADPYDDNSHGTHVAGTMAAVGDNGIGLVGVNWRAKIVACKFIGSNGSGTVSDAIECLDYLLDLQENHNVNIVATNNSWGGGGYSQALYEAIQRHQEAGILFLAAAGNSAVDNDEVPHYPSSYDLTNIISVAATNHDDELAWFSSYGHTTVDVAAPGVDIWSTVLNHAYDSYSGTSMATPHVTGLVGLLKAHEPTYSAQQIKSVILTSGKPLDNLRDKVLSGRRIQAWGDNGRGALTCHDQVLQARVAPAQNIARLLVGDQLTLSYIDLNCVSFGSEARVSVSPGNTYINLQDDGQNADQVAHDGQFTGSFTLGDDQVYTLTFPNQETLVVQPIQPYANAQPIAYSYEEITGTRLSIGDENVRPIDSPFPLHFADAEVGNRIYVSDNGVISFANAYVWFWNQSLPSTSLAPSAILPLWDDWSMFTSDIGVFWDVIGTAPQRQLVIEWRNVQHYRWRTGDSHASFQVILTEGSSDIVVNYKDTTVGHSSYDNGASATVGIQQSYQFAQQYSYNEARIMDGTSFVWRTMNANTPIIEQVSISGNRRITHLLEFQIQALAVGDKTITQYEIDFNGDGIFDYSGEESVVNHVYDRVGSYVLTVRVTDSDGLFAEWTDVLTIEDLTLEEQIERAVRNRELEIMADPSLLGLYSQTDVDEAHAAGIAVVMAAPEDYGLYSFPDCVDVVQANPEMYGLLAGDAALTAAKIDALTPGWHLLASPSEIADLSMFSRVRVVFYYTHGRYYGYSADAATATRLSNSGITPITRIPAGVGVWIKK